MIWSQIPRLGALSSLGFPTEFRNKEKTEAPLWYENVVLIHFQALQFVETTKSFKQSKAGHKHDST